MSILPSFILAISTISLIYKAQKRFEINTEYSCYKKIIIASIIAWPISASIGSMFMFIDDRPGIFPAIGQFFTVHIIILIISLIIFALRSRKEQ